MKDKIIEFLKRNAVGFILGALVCLSIASVAATGILSSELSYTNAKNEDVASVKDALDDLYNKANGIFEEGTTTTYEYTSNGAFSYASSYDTTTITKSTNNSINNSNITINNNVMDIDYIGSENVVKINTTGYYKLEVWGAQGGSLSGSYTGGYGGYSVGIVNLRKNENLYVNVGGEGLSGRIDTTNGLLGGYNGGGDAGPSSDSTCYITSGGGATHIATITKSNEDGKTGELKYLEEYKGTLVNNFYYVSDKILIVAGGGSAGGRNNGWSWSQNGVSGGGYIGLNGLPASRSNTCDKSISTGGTQIAGGEPGCTTYHSFAGGFGAGSSVNRNNSYSHIHSGAGGGFYGGGSVMYSAGGGSGYIASSRLVSGTNVTKHMAAYGATGDYLSNDTETKTIAATGYSATPQADYAKSGNGYARITYCGTSASDC